MMLQMAFMCSQSVVAVVSADRQLHPRLLKVAVSFQALFQSPLVVMVVMEAMVATLISIHLLRLQSQLRAILQRE